MMVPSLEALKLTSLLKKNGDSKTLVYMGYIYRNSHNPHYILKLYFLKYQSI